MAAAKKAKTAAPKLTAGTARAAKPDPKRRRWLFDGGSRESIRGLALAIQPSGGKSWWYSYRLPGEPAQRVKVGAYPDMTLDAARKAAAELSRQVVAGVDPRRARHEAAEAKRREEEEAANRKTVADLAKRYTEEHAATKKAKSSQVNDEVLWRLHILPAIGSKLVDEVTVGDVADLHHAMRETPFQANRMLSLLSKAFNLAVRWRWRSDAMVNPASSAFHDRFAEKSSKRGRALTPEELRRVGDALDRMEDSPAKAAFLFYLLTGCRPHDEAAPLRWEQVDLDGRTVFLEETKTGERSLTLGRRAAELLARQPREGEFVFPSSRRPGRPITTLRYIADRILEEAELPERTRAYDIGRHTFKNLAEEEPAAERGIIGAGILPATVEVLMGHANRTTSPERYRHRAPAALVRAADRVNDVLWGALFGAVEDEGGVVVEADFGRRAG